MNINEFTRPLTSEKLNESLAKTFGKKINLEKFTFEQLEDARNKLRTKLSQVETNESFDKVQTSEYAKNKMFLDVLNAEIKERHESGSAITEGAEDSAEIVMAGKDMVDKVTGWMEDTAEMQTESMLDLADAIRDEMGSEQSESFVNTVKPALEAMYAAMESTRGALTSGVGILTGEGGGMDADMMGGDDMDAMEPTTDMDMDTDLGDLEGDDFDADASAAGGDLDMGREKRESKNIKGKSLGEGAAKGSMMKDAETMSKAAFIKKYGKENAETWGNMNESSKKK